MPFEDKKKDTQKNRHTHTHTHTYTSTLLRRVSTTPYWTWNVCRGNFALKKQTHDTKDGAVLIQYCWPASETSYKLFD